MSDKIIGSFQQRRQLMQEFAELAHTNSEAQLAAAARRLVHSYPADLLVTTLLKHLDTPNSQLRGGLGHVAALLPPDEILPPLRAAAANRANSAQTRVTAALIMERFLGETVPQALLADLSQTNEVAYQSLREAVEEGALNRRVYLDYVTQMYAAGEPIAWMVLELMERLEPAQRVELYRLMVLEDRPAVARAALHRLERLAAEVSAAVVPALVSLSIMAAPELAAAAERSLRKLQFSGIRHTPLPTTGWRSLISPADLGANLSLWFVKMPAPDAIAPEEATQTAGGTLLALVIQPRRGILEAFGNDKLERRQLPAPQRIGRLVRVRAARGQNATLLEIPFDVGRQLLRVVHGAYTGTDTPPTLPGDYRLFGADLWTCEPPHVDDAETAALLAAVGSNAPQPPAPSTDDLKTLSRDVATLMAHPAMRGWLLHQQRLIQDLHTGNAALARLPLQEVARILLRDLEQRPEQRAISETLATGLRLQALYFHLAGEREPASCATRVAAAVPHLALSLNPLLVYLMENSLRALRDADTSLL